MDKSSNPVLVNLSFFKHLKPSTVKVLCAAYGILFVPENIEKSKSDLIEKLRDMNSDEKVTRKNAFIETTV